LWASTACPVQIRRLITRINGDIATASDAERAAIDEAVTVLRRHRGVSLGMPTIRDPAPETRSEATA
jgi:hypothetical protein